MLRVGTTNSKLGFSSDGIFRLAGLLTKFAETRQGVVNKLSHQDREVFDNAPTIAKAPVAAPNVAAAPAPAPADTPAPK